MANTLTTPIWPRNPRVTERPRGPDPLHDPLTPPKARQPGLVSAPGGVNPLWCSAPLKYRVRAPEPDDHEYSRWCLHGATGAEG